MRKVLFFFGELDDADLDWLVEAGRARRVAAGETIVTEGEPLNSLFIVVDGLLSVSVAALGGGEVARLGAGEVIGELSLLDSRPPNATVRAVEDATVFAVPQRTLRTKLDSDSSFAAHFYRAVSIFLANRLRRAVVMSGSGVEALHDEQAEDSDELSPELMETLSLGGTRFNWFLDRVRGS